MERVRKLVGFAPEDFEIKRIENKMGDCIKEKELIIINPYICFQHQTVRSQLTLRKSDM